MKSHLLDTVKQLSIDKVTLKNQLENALRKIKRLEEDIEELKAKKGR